VTLYVLGDSHCGALNQGLARLDRAVLPAGLRIAVGILGNGFYLSQPFFDSDDSAIRITRPDYADALRALTGRDSLIRDESIYAFRIGFHAARLYRDPQWTRFVPAALSDSLPGEPLSQGALEAMIDDDQTHIFAFLAATQRLGLRALVVAAPPPHRNHPCLKDGIPAATLAHVDRRYRERTAARLTAMQLPHVLPPDRAFAQDGFLAASFREGVPDADPHHANAAYGEAMMMRVMRKLGQLGWA
jgi:hypothetical protein